MDHSALKAYILADADLAALAGTPGDLGDYPMSQDGTIADRLNTPAVQVHASTMMTDRALIGALSITHAVGILDALDAASASNSAAKWLMRFMSSEPGLDIGNDNTLSMIDQLAAAGVLTAAQRDALYALSLTTVSIAERDFGKQIHNLDVARALGRVGPAWLR